MAWYAPKNMTFMRQGQPVPHGPPCPAMRRWVLDGGSATHASADLPAVDLGESQWHHLGLKMEGKSPKKNVA